MSFERIIEASWTDNEIAVLRHEASLPERIEEARVGYRAAMESLGTGLGDFAAADEWEQARAEIPTLEEWLDTFDPDNRDYAHDEDDDA